MKKIIVLFLALLLLSMTSCSDEKEEIPLSQEEVVVIPDEMLEETSKEAETSEIPEEPQTDPEATEISLTTGLPCRPEEKIIRPIAVMINNTKVSYPQESVSQADIIYECDMEGGVTRLMAIYSKWHNLGNIGSMRSARNYFIDLANCHDAIYVHAGGSPSAYTEISETGINNIDGVNMYTIPENTFWRDKDRIRQCGYEHSMLTSGENLKNALDTLKYRTEYKNANSYSFNSEFVVPEKGSPAEKVTLVHSDYITVEFLYDVKSSKYLKSSFGADHIDGTNEEQLAFENVMVLFVSESVVDSEGRLDLKLTGNGKGYYLSGGKILDINWSRDKKGTLFNFTYEDGELFLNPGKTHITLFNKNNTKNVIIK